jgi:hypothetical protein
MPNAFFFSTVEVKSSVMRLSELETLIAVRHLAKAVGAEVEALRGQAECGGCGVESLAG